MTKREPVSVASGIMTVGEVTQQMILMQDIMKSVMKEDQHYGLIPGCGKKMSLLQPGAQKIALAFKLVPEYDVEREDLPDNHREYEVTCKLYHQGVYVGCGLGNATTMESRYRYRKAGFECPDCGETAITKGKKEYGGGWLCWKKNGGCGQKWTDEDNPFEGATTDKLEHEDPADYYNTVKKIGMKRALVSAVINTTACSDIFEQDLEDLKANGVEHIIQDDEEKPVTEPPKEPKKGKITVTQAKKLLSLMTDREMTPEEMKALVKDVAKVDTASEIDKDSLPAIKKAIAEWVPAELKEEEPPENAGNKDELPL